jgi:hypothetical protein
MQTVPTRHKQFQRSITVPDDAFRSRFVVRLDTTRYYYCKLSENVKEMARLGKLGVDYNAVYPLKATYSVYDLFQHTKRCSLPIS